MYNLLLLFFIPLFSTYTCPIEDSPTEDFVRLMMFAEQGTQGDNPRRITWQEKEFGPDGTKTISFEIFEDDNYLYGIEGRSGTSARLLIWFDKSYSDEEKKNGQRTLVEEKIIAQVAEANTKPQELIKLDQNTICSKIETYPYSKSLKDPVERGIFMCKCNVRFTKEEWEKIREKLNNNPKYSLEELKKIDEASKLKFLQN